jgi:hypothetical protein
MLEYPCVEIGHVSGEDVREFIAAYTTKRH